MGVPGKGFCPLGKIHSQYPLLLVKGEQNEYITNERIELQAYTHQLAPTQLNS